MMTTFSVLGAGSWGTALAVHLGKNGHPVVLWARRAEMAGRLSRDRTNSQYLPGVELPPSVEPTADLELATRSSVTLVVIPSHGFRAVVRDYLERRSDDRPAVLVSATKGIERGDLCRMSQVVEEEGRSAGNPIRFACLAGPTFAAELARGVPSAGVIASLDPDLASALQERVSGPTLRLYTTSDVVGVELCGTAKNVIAIAAGAVTGLGLGHNTLAALITRGLHEITRLGIACGGEPGTFAGLAGLGDLVLTCTGGLSRNRRTGEELAKGKTRESIDAESPMVAEGVRNAISISRLSEKHDVEMPISETMVQVLYHGKSPRAAVEELMGRDLKSEGEL